jgi:hypothetical protein
MTHEQVPQKLPRRMRESTVGIDKALVPIITGLWRKGWRTRYCCQGDEVPAGEQPRYEHLAYITFYTAAEAALFVAFAGYHRPQRSRRYMGWEPQGWMFDCDTVRFPVSDLERIREAVQQLPRLEALIGAVSATLIPLRAAPPECPRCGWEQIREVAETTIPLRAAPRTCPTCGGVVMSRRKDARYCSRRCQQAARDRRQHCPPVDHADPPSSGQLDARPPAQ